MGISEINKRRRDGYLEPDSETYKYTEGGFSEVQAFSSEVCRGNRGGLYLQGDISAYGKEIEEGLNSLLIFLKLLHII